MHKRVCVEISGREYPIIIGENVLTDSGKYISSIISRPRVAIITDKTVAKLHLPELQSSLTKAGFSILKFEIMNETALKWIQKSIINIKKNNKKGLAFNSLMGKSFQEKYFNLIDEIKKGNLSPVLIISMKHI